MSIRVDTSSLITGAIVCGNRGLGVLGSQVPSTGDQGPGYMYNDLTLPDDANKEVRGLIVTAPSAGVFTTYEDSSFTLTGAPDNTYTFSYTLYVDGVVSGTATGHLSIGTNFVNIPVATIAATTNNMTVVTPNIDIPVLVATLLIHVNPLTVTDGTVAALTSSVIRLQWGKSVVDINLDSQLNQISSVSLDKTDSVVRGSNS